jgi:hypothetical protein
MRPAYLACVARSRTLQGLAFAMARKLDSQFALYPVKVPRRVIAAGALAVQINKHELDMIIEGIGHEIIQRFAVECDADSWLQQNSPEQLLHLVAFFYGESVAWAAGEKSLHHPDNSVDNINHYAKTS